jgi:DNA-directed RNA polymerase subunit N (RpoN/RPB10)
MIPLVVCITCGLPVGDVADIFREMKNDLVRKLLEERGTAATQAAVDTNLQVDCTHIYELLGVKNYCCRKSLASCMLFNDAY